MNFPGFKPRTLQTLDDNLENFGKLTSASVILSEIYKIKDRLREILLVFTRFYVQSPNTIPNYKYSISTMQDYMLLTTTTKVDVNDSSCHSKRERVHQYLFLTC